MTAFSVDFEMGNRQGSQWAMLSGLVDTSSTYTWVPRDVLTELGIVPEFEREFETADSRIIPKEMAVATGRLDGQTLPTLVVFAEPGKAVLLGVYTLEGFSLGVDPVNERLVPVRGLAMSATPLP